MDESGQPSVHLQYLLSKHAELNRKATINGIIHDWEEAPKSILKQTTYQVFCDKNYIYDETSAWSVTEWKKTEREIQQLLNEYGRLVDRKAAGKKKESTLVIKRQLKTNHARMQDIFAKYMFLMTTYVEEMEWVLEFERMGHGLFRFFYKDYQLIDQCKMGSMRELFRLGMEFKWPFQSVYKVLEYVLSMYDGLIDKKDPLPTFDYADFPHQETKAIEAFFERVNGDLKNLKNSIRFRQDLTSPLDQLRRFIPKHPSQVFVPEEAKKQYELLFNSIDKDFVDENPDFFYVGFDNFKRIEEVLDVMFRITERKQTEKNAKRFARSLRMKTNNFLKHFGEGEPEVCSIEELREILGKTLQQVQLIKKENQLLRQVVYDFNLEAKLAIDGLATRANSIFSKEVKIDVHALQQQMKLELDRKNSLLMNKERMQHKDELQRLKKRYENQIRDMNKNISNLKASIDQLTMKLEEQSHLGQQKELTQKNYFLEREKQMQDEINLLKSDIKELRILDEHNRSDNESIISSLQKTIKDLKDDMKQFRKSYESEIQDILRKSKEDLEMCRKEYETRIEEKEKTILKLLVTNGEKDSKIYSLENENSYLANEIERLLCKPQIKHVSIQTDHEQYLTRSDLEKMRAKRKVNFGDNKTIELPVSEEEQLDLSKLRKLLILT